MVRLGLRLTLRSGREAFVRLALTTVAVAVGVALLLGVLAEFHAFQANSNRSCWECTQGSSLPAQLPSHGDLWNNSVDFYQGQTIQRLDVAPLGPSAPVPPGISRLPGPGQYYASPALAALLHTVPADELGARFPGTMIGTIGDKALSGPAELAIYIGYTPSALRAIQGTQLVTAISTAPAPEVFTSFFRYAFGVGVLAVVFPILILVGTATRLAAARREERFAALRLVGATPRDISVIASVESIVSAFCGTVLGIVVFLLVQPALAGAALIGTRYFSSTVTPTLWGYIGMLVAVPVASAIASLMSLRRVQISPLGVSRRAAARPPTVWRLTTLVVGVILFVVGLLLTTHKSIGAPAYPGLLVTMIGLVIAGPWLTAAAARLFARVARGPSPLLATRRLADNPRAAFRSVSGLVLAVFLGTMVGVLVPAVESFTATLGAASLNNVLLDTFGNGPASIGPGPGGPAAASSGPTPAQLQAALGLTPKAGTKLVSQLHGFAGTTVYPLYSLPQAANLNYPGEYIGVISCSALRGLAVLGQCAPGLQVVQVNDQLLIHSDNPRNSTAAFVSSSNPAYTGRLPSLSLQAVLVRVNSPATLERVRTFLATHTPPSVSAGPGAAPTPPRTYGEAVAIRAGRAVMMGKLVDAAVALTLIVAGCSLAVAVGGGLVDRKRPFTLLRVSGTPVSALSKVVLIEAALPLAAATVIAACIAYGTSVLAIIRLAPAGMAIPQLGHVYYATMGTGLAIALLVILLTLPLLGRMTGPGNVRFE
jgi:FtsX-like permease family